MTTNRAGYIDGKGATVVVKEAPYPTPEPNDIVLRVRALAFNPADPGIQERGTDLFSFIKYPIVLGFDIAGDVAAVGSSVTQFKEGDRVLGLVMGIMKNQPERGGFQEYALVESKFVCKIPDNLSYEQASVLPATLVTAAAGLFPKHQLGLDLPKSQRVPNGKTLLVWGASTSVGSNAIQLAVAAGYDVIATCSPKNFDYVKRLGASEAFDYNSPTVVEDIVSAFKGKECVGGITCAMGSPDGAFGVLQKVQGEKWLASAWWLPENLPEDVGTKFIQMDDVMSSEELTTLLFTEFLPKALEAGSYVAAPDAYVFGKGLESIQGAMDHLKKGVSATKVVITM